MPKIVWFSVLSICWIVSTVQAQILPSARSVDWKIAGSVDFITENLAVLDFDAEGGVADGITDNGEILSSAFRLLGEDGGIISFSEGTYLFKSPIFIPAGVILKGISAQETNLLFDLEGSHHLINIIGSSQNVTANLSEDAEKDAIAIFATSTDFFQLGDYCKLIEEDQDLVTSSWAIHSTGQINQIIDIDDGKISLKDPLRRSFSLEKEARIIKLNPIQGAGLECLKIERLDATEQQFSNVYMANAANCRLKGIESEHCNFAHVEINNSTNIIVEDSYFHDAFDFGGGGKAYGVVLQFNTGACLVENNIFDHLRHAMLLQAGANGNVVSYNYSINPFWTGVSLPANSAGDITLHGNYVYANLFEGNIVQNIVIDDSHGANGPYNTFFRNRAESFGIFMNNNPPSNSQNFIGNEMPNTGLFMGLYLLNGNDHFEAANNVQGQSVPPNSAEMEMESYYLLETPAYYITNNMVFPPIGLPNTMSENNNNESMYRFSIDEMTVCEDALSTSISDVFNTDIELSVYPIPFNNELTVLASQKIENINIMLPNGQLVATSQDNTLYLSTLASGLYFVETIFENGNTVVRKVVKR